VSRIYQGKEWNTFPISSPKRVKSNEGQAPHFGKLRDIFVVSARGFDIPARES